MFGLTTWEQAALMALVWLAVQLVLLGLWFRFARHKEHRRRDVMLDDPSPNVFDDE